MSPRLCRALFRFAGVAALTLLGLALSSCQPYYRDDELRALRAERSTCRDQRSTAGDRLLAAGQPDRAIRSFEEAIACSARREADLYLRLATAQQRSHRSTLAAATARYALTRPELQTGIHQRLRRLLVEIYAHMGLTRLALDWLEPATLSHAAGLPALQPTLALLAEADSLSERAPQRALAKYAEWLSSYGEPDHALLRNARNRILRAASPHTAGWAQQADALLAQGQPEAAVRRYALVYRYHTDAAFAAERSGFLRACAALPAPESYSPLATAELRSATTAIQHGDLAGALLHTRRAVTAAPCWSHAQNLLRAILQSLDAPNRSP